MNDRDKEYFRVTEFWNDILIAIVRYSDKNLDHDNNTSTLKSIFMMSGLLTAAADILKTFNQEMYPGFTPELQEQIDKKMRIFVRRQSAEILRKILGDEST